AVLYGEMAAVKAENVFAYGEAVRLWEHTIKAQKSVDSSGLKKLCDLLLSLGDALLNEGDAKRILEIEAPRAWSLAQSIPDTDQSSRVCHLAMLALFYSGTYMSLKSPESSLWVERARNNTLPDNVAGIQADITMGIGRCVNWDLVDGIRLLGQARESAWKTGDCDTCWWANAMWLLFSSGYRQSDKLLETAGSLSRASQEGVGAAVLIWGFVMIADTYLDHGRRSEAEEVWHEVRKLIERYGQAQYQVFGMAGDALFATLDGELERAVEIMNQITAFGRDQEYDTLAGVLVFMIGMTPMLYLGRIDNAIEYASGYSPAAEALCLAHDDQISKARDILTKIIDWFYPSRPDGKRQAEPGTLHPFRQVPTPTNPGDEIPVYEDTLLLQTAVLVGDIKAAELLMHRLKNCELSTTGIFHTTCIDRHLGKASELLGKYEDALQYYRKALEVSRSMKYRPETALTSLHLAELILKHFPDDTAQAWEYLEFAVIEFREMKMKFSLEQALRNRRFFAQPNGNSNGEETRYG
ncbi:tetratricopeptide repeat protein, partial [Chloroflexota bacterium]